MTKIKQDVTIDKKELHRQDMARREREKYQSVRELGDLPPCSDPALRERLRLDLVEFACVCYPHIVTAEFGKPHLDLLAALQSAVLNGESAVLALPRGYGKSSLALIAATWAILYAHRRYVLLIGASAMAGKRLIRNIRSELLYNPVIGAAGVTPDSNDDNLTDGGLYPEVTYPLRKIGAANRRAAGQLYHGEPTRAVLSADRIELPTIDGAPTSGLVIESTGLSGEIRGKNHTTSAGSLRPDLVLIDDPQTDKSARSATQTEQRFDLINGCINGLSSVDNPIAMVATVTVIEDDDLACKLLKSNYWRSVKYGVVNKLPSEAQLELWSEYNNLRVKLIEEGKNDVEIQAELNAYFVANQDALTGEMEPTWAAFKNPGDVSPLQKIMQLYYEDYGAFVRERMNDPGLAMTAELQSLTIDNLVKKINNYPRNIVPLDVEAITAGCDSQTLGIYWTVVGHCADGSAYVLDYGKLPKGRKTITAAYGNKPLEECVYLGYSELLRELLSRRYRRQDGLDMTISKVLVDASHGPTNPKVLQAIVDTQDNRVQPVYGRASTPDRELFGKRKPGELRGQGWAMPPIKFAKGQANARHIILDVNSWKSALQSKLLAGQGTAGSMTIYKDAPANHNEFLQHLTAERSSPLSGRFGTIDVWRLLPNRLNHYWDTLVYATAAGSMVAMAGSPSNNPRINGQFERRRVTAADRQKQSKNWGG